MADRDDRQGRAAPHPRSRELVEWLRARVHGFVSERLDTLFSTAIEQFLDTAGSARSQREQVHFFDAYKLLRKEREAVGDALLMAVDYNFRELGRVTSNAMGSEEDLSLQLVENEMLEEMITLDNMVSKVVERSGQVMELLSSRLGHLVGRPLSEHDNPLVPEFLCEAFSRQVARLSLDFDPKLAFYSIFETTVLKDWPVLVQACNEHLREEGILPDLEKRRHQIRKKTPAASDPDDAVFDHTPEAAASTKGGPAPGTPGGGGAGVAGAPSSSGFAPRHEAIDGVPQGGAAPTGASHGGVAQGGAFPGGAPQGGAVQSGAVQGGASLEEASQAGASPGGATNGGALHGGALHGGALHGGAMPGAGGSPMGGSGGGVWRESRSGPEVANHTRDVLADLYRQGWEQSAAHESAERNAEAGRSASLDADQLAALFSAWLQGEGRQAALDSLAQQGLKGALNTILAGHNQGPEALRSMDRSLLDVLDRTFARLAQAVYHKHESDLLLNLELPAAWLALKDPLFLERSNHPGRRLLNELFRVNSILGTEESGADPLRRKVDDIVDRLNGFDVTLRQISQLLTDLIDVIERDKRTIGLREERVLQEADSQARMALAHEQVLQVLSDRLVGRRWPGFLVSFCEKAWSRVLFLACLRHGQHSAEWRQVLGLLDRVLVVASARRALAAGERAELVAAIQAELDHIGYDPVDMGHYLAGFASFLESLGADGPVDDDHASPDALSVDLPGQRLQQEDVPQDLDPETLAFVDALRRGSWVEFREADKVLRCKLAGSIKASSRLVFTNRRGIKVAEEHRHRMAVKMQEGKVIVLDNSHLFDQAYHQVIDEVQSELRGQAGRA